MESDDRANPCQKVVGAALSDLINQGLHLGVPAFDLQGYGKTRCTLFCELLSFRQTTKLYQLLAQCNTDFASQSSDGLCLFGVVEVRVGQRKGFVQHRQSFVYVVLTYPILGKRHQSLAAFNFYFSFLAGLWLFCVHQQIQQIMQNAAFKKSQTPIYRTNLPFVSESGYSSLHSYEFQIDQKQADFSTFILLYKYHQKAVFCQSLIIFQNLLDCFHQSHLLFNLVILHYPQAGVTLQILLREFYHQIYPINKKFKKVVTPQFSHSVKTINKYQLFAILSQPKHLFPYQNQYFTQQISQEENEPTILTLLSKYSIPNLFQQTESYLFFIQCFGLIFELVQVGNRQYNFPQNIHYNDTEGSQNQISLCNIESVQFPQCRKNCNRFIKSIEKHDFSSFVSEWTYSTSNYPDTQVLSQLSQ